MLATALLPAAVVAAAIVPALLFLWLVVAADSRLEPPRQVAIAVGLGALAAFAAVIVEFTLQHLVPLATSPWAAGYQEGFLFAALPEEALKVSAIAVIALRARHFDEPMDGVVYGTAVGLGFAAVENLLYVAGSANWGGVAMLRGVLSVPFHGALGAIAGAYIARARFGGALGSHRGTHGRRQRLFALAFLIPLVLHTLFDAPIFVLQKATKIYADDALPMGMVVQLLLMPVVGFGSIIFAAILARRIAHRQKAAFDTKRLPPAHWRGIWGECLLGVAGGFIGVGLVVAGEPIAQLIGVLLMASAITLARRCARRLNATAQAVAPAT